jgi:SAM-dependent methyltransferase
MSSQASNWSRVAENYEVDFIDPYSSGVRNPLPAVLERMANEGSSVTADLGCGTGPLLPYLARHFATVYAVDFAAEMLRRARERCRTLTNITYLEQPLTDLGNLTGQLDVAVAVNSLVMPDLLELETCLQQIHDSLRPGGRLLAVLPAIDAVHYCTMLLMDRALAAGKPLDAARRNAAFFGDHALYDFAFGQFFYKGLEQHFWQPFEIEYRLRRANFGAIEMAKLELPWDQFTCGDDLKDEAPPWDWFVQAVRER